MASGHATAGATHYPRTNLLPTAGAARSTGGPAPRIRGQLWIAAPVAAVVALMILGSIGGPLLLSPPGAGTAALPHAKAPTSTAGTIRPSATSTACASGRHGSAAAAAGADLAPAASHRPTAARASSPPQSPLFNSQVVPYAVLTGPYAYVAKGAAMRDQGYGQINLTWPGGSTSNLVAAYMLWSEMNNSVPPSYGTLNGVNVSGTWTAYATPSPCWSQTYIYTFVAEVTSDVVNGVNNLTNFPSSITNGYDPWNQSENGILDEGASLIAIYDVGGKSIQQITVYSGAETTEGTTLSEQLNYSTANRTSATTTYIIADGQLPGNEAEWNGTVIDANAFPGSDPKESPYAWSYGNLSDTKTYAVNVTAGVNNTTAVTFPTDGDCFTWVGQVLSVGVPALPPPYTVDFQEQGLNNGATWKVTTNGTTKTGTVSNGTSSLKFKVLNGTYSFSIPGVPGYTASQSKGNYTIAGGPMFIRVLFHVILYPITFNETGLPTGSEWEATLSNTSQALDDVLEAYAPAGMLFSAANGTYNFTAVEYGLYTPEPANGTITVDGSAVVEMITFVPPPLYPVTFQENGLPPNTLWGAYVDTNWGSFDNSTSTRTFLLELPNTTYSDDYLTAFAVSGFAAPSTTYFAVSGAPETVDVNYSLLYPLYFNETGLPNGTAWALQASGTAGYFNGASTNATIELEVPNGTFDFYITPVWAYTATPASGTVTVDGMFANQSIVFTLAPTYLVQFNETGLPAGTSWSVQVDLPNGSFLVRLGTGTTITFAEPNGTYEFVVGTVAGYTASPSYEYFGVYGAPVYEDISFFAVYAVTFTESGLPSGTEWEVSFNAYNYSFTPTIGFEVTNGTYEYYVEPIGSFAPTPSTGTETVNGSGLVIPVVFVSPEEPTYTVTFTEAGLAPSTNWTVTLDGYAEATTGASLNFTEANGSFPFAVGGAVGYVANPASGTLDVSGGPAQQAIQFALESGLFAVTFTETGLPNGATWYVNITGETGLSATVTSSSGHAVSMSLVNGSYTFAAATSEKGWKTTAGGPFTVNGATVSESVPFTSTAPPPPATFTVTFVEQNLPIGVTWYINITGESGLSATVASSSGTQVSISLTNASYSYTAASNSKNWTASGGSFTVSGASGQVNVGFKSSNSPTNSSSGSGLNVPWSWIALAILIGAALLLILFAVFRRRKKKEEKGGPGSWSGTAAGTPPAPGTGGSPPKTG